MSRGRVPSAVAIDRYSDSGKCDVYFTAKADDIIYGFLSKVDPDQKPALDKAEGLGFGYGQKRGGGTAQDSRSIKTVTYVATHIDQTLKPYYWYINQVLIGECEISLASKYLECKINCVEAT